jgi:arabinose-5-phosphate isomerase
MIISPQEVLFKEAHCILQVAKNLGNELDPIIELIYNNVIDGKHTIITGIGKNSDIACKMAATYSSIGIPAFYLDAYKALHGDLGVVLPGSVIVGLSKSGNTEELNYTFEACGKRGAKLISLTCNKESSLGKITKRFEGIDVAFVCEGEADEHNLAPTSSSTLFLAIGDAIGCSVSSRLLWSREQFLMNHPAGSLGKQLRQEGK